MEQMISDVEDEKEEIEVNNVKVELQPDNEEELHV